MFSRLFSCLALPTVLLIGGLSAPGHAEQGLWKKHVVHSLGYNTTAVAADFTGDGKVDVMCHFGGKVRLYVAPDWKEVVVRETPGIDSIHSAVMDVNGDGRPDFIGTRYSPGFIFWLECPPNPTKEPWPLHVIDDQVDGVHGLLVGDVDRDGKPDLLANSAEPKGPFARSAVWYRVPRDPRQRWERHVFAQGDAPGNSHYLGLGDVNGDGRPDIVLAAKGVPANAPNANGWFAWWEQPTDLAKPWKKHLIAANQPGATNIHPADVNGDGKTDFVATRGHDRGVYWFEAPDWKMHVIHPTLKEPHCLVLADFNGDGIVDAATCGYGDRLVYWFENDGKGQFKPHLIARDQAAYDIRAVDMDGDGDLDLLIAGQQSNNVVWLENPKK
jgi:hypothetical protein